MLLFKNMLETEQLAYLIVGMFISVLQLAVRYPCKGL